MNRPSYLALLSALERAEDSRACIRQNRGPERAEARVGYEHAVDELVPFMRDALADLCADLDARDVERIGRVLLRAAQKFGSR